MWPFNVILGNIYAALDLHVGIWMYNNNHMSPCTKKLLLAHKQIPRWHHEDSAIICYLRNGPLLSTLKRANEVFELGTSFSDVHDVGGFDGQDLAERDIRDSRSSESV